MMITEHSKRVGSWRLWTVSASAAASQSHSSS
jgi:hypothetical protein